MPNNNSIWSQVYLYPLSSQSHGKSGGEKIPKLLFIEHYYRLSHRKRPITARRGSSTAGRRPTAGARLRATAGARLRLPLAGARVLDRRRPDPRASGSGPAWSSTADGARAFPAAPSPPFFLGMGASGGGRGASGAAAWGCKAAAWTIFFFCFVTGSTLPG